MADDDESGPGRRTRPLVVRRWTALVVPLRGRRVEPHGERLASHTGLHVVAAHVARLVPAPSSPRPSAPDNRRGCVKHPIGG